MSTDICDEWVIYIWVFIEIIIEDNHGKDDGDDCEENKAKYKYAVQHFAELNKRLEGENIPERYIFHFLSPNSYNIFFDHLRDGTVLLGQDNFRCALENMLEDN